MTDVEEEVGAIVPEPSLPEPDAEPADLLDASEPAAEEEPTAATAGPDGEARRTKQRRHRRLQSGQEEAAGTTTVYDMTSPTADGSPVSVTQQPTAVAQQTVVAVPIELGESAGGSTLKVVAITDSETLEESYQLLVTLPGITVRVGVCVYS